MGEGRVLGCFCARLLVSCFLLCLLGLARNSLAHAKITSLAQAPMQHMHLLDDEEARAKVNSLANMHEPTLNRRCDSLARTGMLLRWNDTFLI